jgi:uncharacterized protein YdeI (YjbR/CyaY-like superfamily)
MAHLPAGAIHPRTRAAWRRWLECNHARGSGVWLVDWKAASGRRPIGYEAAVEEALCFGWIDSRPRKLDAERSMLWFAPRKAGSGWSAPNKRRVERLLAAGLMAPPGLAKVEAAQRDGSWSALDAVEALEVPPDLALEFERHAGATAGFAAFPSSARRGILEWIANARRAETRARRIEETAALAARGERANQWRPKPARDDAIARTDRDGAIG